MRYTLIALLLTACSSAPTTAWNTCVDEKAHIGYRLKNHSTGAIGTVTRIYGRSERCADPGHPILAQVSYE